MCGRYYLADAEKISRRFALREESDWLKPRYNIAPSQEIPVIIKDGGRRLVRFAWGLVPFWSRGKLRDRGIINARAETVAGKPSFGHAFRRQRCLIPAEGFFEWKKTGNQKTPYRIGLKDEELFAFAGLWDSLKLPDGNLYYSCTIITTVPNDLVAMLHQRMPVILSREGEDAWLNTEPAHALALQKYLTPYPAEEMVSYPVSNLVNSPKNDSADCLIPVPIQKQITLPGTN